MATEEIIITTDKAVKNIDDLSTSIDKSTKSTEEQGKAVEKTSGDMLDMADGVSIAGVSIGGLRRGFAGFTTALKLGVTSLKSFKIALAATGIGLFVIAIAALAQHFTDTEEGANKLNKIMIQVGIVFGNLSDILSNFGKLLFAAVTGDVDTIVEAWEEIKDGVSNFISQTKEELKAGRAVADMEAALLVKRRDFIVKQQEIEAKVADLRLKSRMEEEFTSQQRLEFLRQARDIQDEMAQLEREMAEDSLEIVKTRNTFSKSNTVNLDAEAEAQAELSRIETSRLNKNRQVQRELIRVLGQVRRDELKAEKAFSEALTKSDNALLASRINITEEGLDVARDAHRQKLDFTRIEVESSVAAAQVEVDLQKAKRDALLGLASQTFNEIGRSLEKGTLAAKAAAIGSIILNSAIAAIKIWASLGPLAPFAIPFLAAATVNALNRVRRIIVPPAPRFAVGGFVEGPDHAHGGVNINAEGGEGVINARSMAMPGVRAAASYLNTRGGYGVKFQDGGIIPRGLNRDILEQSGVQFVPVLPIDSLHEVENQAAITEIRAEL